MSRLALYWLMRTSMASSPTGGTPRDAVNTSTSQSNSASLETGSICGSSRRRPAVEPGSVRLRTVPCGIRRDRKCRCRRGPVPSSFNPVRTVPPTSPAPRDGIATPCSASRGKLKALRTSGQTPCWRRSRHVRDKLCQPVHPSAGKTGKSRFTPSGSSNSARSEIAKNPRLFSGLRDTRNTSG